MLNKRASRLLLAGATIVAAAAAVTGVSVTASGASNASTPARPGLNAPNLHGRAVAAPGPTDTCGYHATIPADRFEGIPVFDPTLAAQPFDVRFVTTQGIITVRMLTAQAPCTTFSFRFLASKGYFNPSEHPTIKMHCHRLTTQGIFVLQCGDPTGTGSGGPGYAFNDENLAGATYPAGTVAMANAGPNTNGSQFFVISGPDGVRLPPLYSHFGEVVKGLDVVEKINGVGSRSGTPTERVVIESVTIAEED
jgi:peptidyl-prolyl cis-trans isomerase B (cyclophilin B)